MEDNSSVMQWNYRNQVEQLGDLAATLSFTQKYSIAKNYGVNRMNSVLKITGIYHINDETRGLEFTIAVTPKYSDWEDSYRSYDLSYSNARMEIMKIIEKEDILIQEIESDFYIQQ